jgi:hypothetical protein
MKHQSSSDLLDLMRDIEREDHEDSGPTPAGFVATMLCAVFMILVWAALLS